MAITHRANAPPPPADADTSTPTDIIPAPPAEINGPSGPEPTRYGDWEHRGRCTDF